MASQELPGRPVGEAVVPNRDQIPAVSGVEMSGFPFPGDLGRKIFQLHQRGIGRLFGYSSGNQEPGAQAFMFGMPYRESNREGGPDTQALLIAPDGGSYRFLVVSPLQEQNGQIDFGRLLMSPGEPVILSGTDSFSDFILQRRRVIPSIETVYEITEKTNQEKAWRDALGFTEAMDAKRRYPVDEASIHQLGGSVAQVIVTLGQAMDAYQRDKSRAIDQRQGIPEYPQVGQILPELATFDPRKAA